MPPSPLLLGFGGLAVLALLVVAAASVPASSRGSIAGEGRLTLAHSGVHMNMRLWAMMTRIRAETPASIPIKITSGTRTPSGQAAAMAYKLDHGEDLDDLYDDALVAELLALSKPVHRPGGGDYAYDNLDPWADAIQAMMDRGVYISPHLRGDACDVNLSELTTDQRAQLIAAVQRAGYTYQVEKTPLHLHVNAS